jgi:hypothetical protein
MRFQYKIAQVFVKLTMRKYVVRAGSRRAFASRDPLDDPSSWLRRLYDWRRGVFWHKLPGDGTALLALQDELEKGRESRRPRVSASRSAILCKKVLIR